MLLVETSDKVGLQSCPLSTCYDVYWPLAGISGALRWLSPLGQTSLEERGAWTDLTFVAVCVGLV